MREKKFLMGVLVIALVFGMTVVGCEEEPTDGDNELVSEGVIPEEIYKEFTESMPIYSGTTPPDISGEYKVSPLKLVASSLNDAIGKVYADQFVAFLKSSDGKLKYMSSQAGDTYSSEDVTVKIVGEDNYFTAYFISTGSSYGISTEQSVLISGRLDSQGIQDYHYAFIMLDKGSDPSGLLVPINTYRIFNDGDGMANRHTWR